MLNIILRDTIPPDFKGIRAILSESNLVDQHFTEEKFRTVLSRNTGYCFVAVVDGEIVGAAFGTHDGAFNGYIQNVAVNKKYRRQKIASKMVKKILDKFDESKIPRVLVHLNKVDEVGVAFFKTLGFDVRDAFTLMTRHAKAPTKK